jgi:ribosome-binding factor A
MEKINQELKRQIMQIIQREVDNPIAEFLSITRVDTTKDLQESKVYFSLLDENKYQEAKQILDEMKGFIRTILGKNIRLKVLPQLTFLADESIKYSVDIYQKIEEIKEQDKKDAKKNTD